MPHHPHSRGAGRNDQQERPSRNSSTAGLVVVLRPQRCEGLLVRGHAAVVEGGARNRLAAEQPLDRLHVRTFVCSEYTCPSRFRASAPPTAPPPRTNPVRLLAALETPADRLLVRFLAETGLRVSELKALRWSDLELGDEPVVVVRRRHRLLDGEQETKSERSAGDVPITRELGRELKTHRLRGGHPDRHAFVFTAADGSRLGRAGHRQPVSRAVLLEETPLQDLRALVRVGRQVLRAVAEVPVSYSSPRWASRSRTL